MTSVYRFNCRLVTLLLHWHWQTSDRPTQHSVIEIWKHEMYDIGFNWRCNLSRITAWIQLATVSIVLPLMCQHASLQHPFLATLRHYSFSIGGIDGLPSPTCITVTGWYTPHSFVCMNSLKKLYPKQGAWAGPSPGRQAHLVAWKHSQNGTVLLFTLPGECPLAHAYGRPCSMSQCSVPVHIDKIDGFEMHGLWS